MERFSRQTQPAPQRAHQPAAAPAPAPASKKTKGNQPSFASKMLVVMLIVVSVLVVIVLAVATFNRTSASNSIKSDQYQAVFLDNGQVYFGKLANLNGTYVELTDIYYLQVDQQVQPDQDATPQQQISLAKLGNELHGPEDVMYINPDKVVFWENLKTDGQVTTAIVEYQANPPTEQQQQQQPADTTTTPTEEQPVEDTPATP